MNPRFFLTAWAAALGFTSTLYAEVRLSPVFGSQMVLQRDVPVTLSGWADPGEAVEVWIGDREVGRAVGAGPKTAWTVPLPVLQAGPVSDITIKGKNTLKLTDLLAGDVWVFSGQSNMEMTLAKGPWCEYGGVVDADREVAAANQPQLRLFNARENSGWTLCTPETARRFSAAAYFFGREVARQQDVPVGLVMVAVGGTAAEYWLPRATREAWSGFPPRLAEAKRTLAELGPIDEAQRQAMADWQKASKQAQKDGQPVPPKPAPKLDATQQERLAVARVIENTGFYYEKRVAPLTALRIKGAVWYQGEANLARHAEYQDLMTQLIGAWRQGWGQGDFPFLIMQLVNFGTKNPPGVNLWAELRAAQQAVAESVPNVGLAVGIDIGDPKNIHPANKQDVGRRLALVALKQVYGRDVVAAGPKPTAIRFEGAQARVDFDQPLLVKTERASGFELAGADGIFQPATAQAQGANVTVTSAQVPAPLTVRYAWQDNPAVSLFNAEGLPVAPFARTRESAGGRLGTNSAVDDAEPNINAVDVIVVMR